MVKLIFVEFVVYYTNLQAAEDTHFHRFKHRIVITMLTYGIDRRIHKFMQVALGKLRPFHIPIVIWFEVH
jgi:hypothetical protein